MAALSAYTYKKKVTADTSDETGVDVASTQSDFPAVFHMTTTSWGTTSEREHLYETHADWEKRVSFYTDGDQTTPLKYEVEYHADDASSEATEAVWHVKIPSVTGDSATAAEIWIGYGNDAGAADQDDPTNVWDANFVMVQHLGDAQWGSSPEAKDSTSNNNDGTNDGTTDVAGAVRRGRGFDGTDDKITVTDDNTLDFGAGSATVSVWVAASGLQDTIVHHYILDSPWSGWAFGLNETGHPRWWNGANWRVSNTTAHDGVLRHLAVSDNTTACSFYRNGVSDGSPGTTGGNKTTTVNMLFGFNDATEFLTGTLDEIRVSATARSADWIKLEYHSMYATAWNGDGLWTWSAEDSGVIQKSLSVVASSVVLISRDTNKGLSVSSAADPSILKKTNTSFSVSASAVASVVRKTLRPLAASASAVASVARNALKSLSATGTGTAGGSRVTKKALSTLASIVPTISPYKIGEVIQKALSVTASAVVSISRGTSKLLSASATAVPTLSHRTRISLAIAASAVASVTSKTLKSLTAAASIIPTISAHKIGEVIQKALSVTVSAVVSLSRKTSKSLSVTGTGTATRGATTVKKGLSISASVVVSATKGIRKGLSVVASVVTRITNDQVRRFVRPLFGILGSSRPNRSRLLTSRPRRSKLGS